MLFDNFSLLVSVVLSLQKQKILEYRAGSLALFYSQKWPQIYFSNWLLLSALLKEYRCKSGFSLWFQSCRDIDECASKINWCGDLNCKNTVGSYTCSCSSGLKETPVFNFEYQRIETQCRDIDECQRRNICPRDATCVNKHGNYRRMW